MSGLGIKVDLDSIEIRKAISATPVAGDPNVLYLGGDANEPTGTVYAVTVERGDDGGIIAFGCAEVVPFTAMPNIDGGLEFGITRHDRRRLRKVGR